MAVRISPSARSMGFWSAVLSTLFSVAYVVAQIAEWIGLLGSQGGPESGSTPLGLALLLTPSLLLGASFLVLVVSIDEYPPLAAPDLFEQAYLVQGRQSPRLKIASAPRWLQRNDDWDRRAGSSD